MTVGFGATAGAGIVVVPASTLTIVKTVSGPVPEGTTFTVSIDCNISIIDNGLSGTDHRTVKFDETGQTTTYECDGEATALPGAVVAKANFTG